MRDASTLTASRRPAARANPSRARETWPDTASLYHIFRICGRMGNSETAVKVRKIAVSWTVTSRGQQGGRVDVPDSALFSAARCSLQGMATGSSWGPFTDAKSAPAERRNRPPAGALACFAKALCCQSQGTAVRPSPPMELSRPIHGKSQRYCIIASIRVEDVLVMTLPKSPG